VGKLFASIAVVMMVLFIMAPAPASAVVDHSPEGLGDVLIFPYYTVNNGWETLFNITNTGDVTVAVKFRFREGLESVDVYDFNVVMSPYDVFTGWVTLGANGPEFHTNDNSCTSPSLAGANAQFVTEALPAGEEIRAYEGYLEVIMMGVAKDENDPVAVAAKHKANGEPNDCVEVDEAFLKDHIADTQDQFKGNENVLKGMFTLLNKERGVAAGGEPLTLKDFAPKGKSECQDNGTKYCIIGNNITAQEPPDFAHPNLADGDGTDGTDGLAWLEEAIAVVALENGWSANEASGVETDWVIALPTKHFHVKWREKTTEAAEAAGITQQIIFTDFVTVWGDPKCGSSANALFEGLYPVDDTTPITIFDREEKTVTSGTVISPRPGITFELCSEINVLTFADSSTAPGTLDSRIRQVIDTNRVGKYGWARIPMNPDDGVPATAFSIWTRDFGDPTFSYGNLVDHAYDRPTVETPTRPLYAFLTTDGHDGDFTEGGKYATGLEGATAFCQSQAEVTGTKLPSGLNWRPWLSTGTYQPADDPRFTNNTTGWKRTDESMIATNWEDLVDGSLLAALKLDAATALIEGAVWTATMPNGRLTPPSVSSGELSNDCAS
jgi:hypothetical protein